MTENICPVCGYDELAEPAYDEDGGGNFEICSSCRFHFGYHDRGYGIEEQETHLIHKQWREKWVKEGMKYYYLPNKPDNWDPIKQLRNIGVIVSK